MPGARSTLRLEAQAGLILETEAAADLERDLVEEVVVPPRLELGSVFRRAPLGSGGARRVRGGGAPRCGSGTVGSLRNDGAPDSPTRPRASLNWVRVRYGEVPNLGSGRTPGQVQRGGEGRRAPDPPSPRTCALCQVREWQVHAPTTPAHRLERHPAMPSPA